MMTDCAFTGSSGFIGTNLISYLNSKGFTYQAISRGQLQYIKKQDIGNCKTLIHLAGKAHDLKGVSNYTEYYTVNYELTRKAYDAFLLSDAEKFIFLSSVKACADQVSGVLTENDEPNPQTHYGKSKLMAEQYIQSQPLPVGKLYYILRPCMVYGPGNKGNLNLLYQLIKKGLPYPLAGFNNKRSFLSVSNLGFIISEIISSDNIPSGVYHVSDDESLSTTEVITLIAQAVNREPVFWNISPKVIKLLAKVGDVLNLPFTTERLQKLTESYVVSNTKIKQAIKKPLPQSIRNNLGFSVTQFSNSVYT